MRRPKTSFLSIIDSIKEACGKTTGTPRQVRHHVNAFISDPNKTNLQTLHKTVQYALGQNTTDKQIGKCIKDLLGNFLTGKPLVDLCYQIDIAYNISFFDNNKQPLAILVSIVGLATLCAGIFSPKPIELPTPQGVSTPLNPFVAAIGCALVTLLTRIGIACLKKVDWKDKKLTHATLQEIHSLSKWRLASEVEIQLRCGSSDNCVGLPPGVKVTCQRVNGKINTNEEIRWDGTWTTKESMDTFLVPGQLLKLRLHPKDILQVDAHKTQHLLSIVDVQFLKTNPFFI
jgi:hypothetical protein